MKINWFKIEKSFSDVIILLVRIIISNYNDNTAIKSLYNLLLIGNICKDCKYNFIMCKCSHYDLQYSEISIFNFIIYNFNFNLINKLEKELNERLILIESGTYSKLTKQKIIKRVKNTIKRFYEN